MQKKKVLLIPIALILLFSAGCQKKVVTEPEKELEQIQEIEEETSAIYFEDVENNKTLSDWKAINSDVQYLLKIDEREFPVVFNQQDDYYLRKDVWKNYDRFGTTFLDESSELDTRNKILYAHSSLTKDIVFNFVENYFGDDAESYYEDHSTFVLEDDSGEHTYMIYAALEIDTKEDPWMGWYIPNTDEEFDLVVYLADVLKNADHVFSSKVSTKAPLLAIVTCNMDTYDFETKEANNRYILFAQEVL